VQVFLVKQCYVMCSDFDSVFAL